MTKPIDRETEDNVLDTLTAPLNQKTQLHFHFYNPTSARTRVDFWIRYADRTSYAVTFFTSGELAKTLDKWPRLQIDGKTPVKDLRLTGEGEPVLITGTPKGVVKTGGGKDVLVVAVPNASVNAELGADDDIAIGAKGNDSLDGGSGADFLDGNLGNDVLTGKKGRDTLHGGGGNDRLSGGADDDLLFGNDDADDLRGDDGNDTLYGGSGSDTLFGGAGADLMNGDAGADELHGETGNDTLIAGGGNDTLWGDAGNDTFVFDITAIGYTAGIKDFNDGDRIDVRAFENATGLSTVNNTKRGYITYAFVFGDGRTAMLDIYTNKSYKDFLDHEKSYFIGLPSQQ